MKKKKCKYKDTYKDIFLIISFYFFPPTGCSYKKWSELSIGGGDWYDIFHLIY